MHVLNNDQVNNNCWSLITLHNNTIGNEFVTAIYWKRKVVKKQSKNALIYLHYDKLPQNSGFNYQ